MHTISNREVLLLDAVCLHSLSLGFIQRTNDWISLRMILHLAHFTKAYIHNWFSFNLSWPRLVPCLLHLFAGKVSRNNFYFHHDIMNQLFQQLHYVAGYSRLSCYGRAICMESHSVVNVTHSQNALDHSSYDYNNI